MTEQCRPLIEILAEIPDPRHGQGKRYALSSLLALACAALLCGYRSYSAMAEWGWNYDQAPQRTLGFRDGQTPSGTLKTSHIGCAMSPVTKTAPKSGAACLGMPQVMAALRNLAIGLLRWTGETNIAAACRRLAAQPESALALIGIKMEN